MNMSRIRTIKYPAYMILFPWQQRHTYDFVIPHSEETGVERIKALFKRGKHGLHPHMQMVLSTTAYGILGGSLFGSFFSTKSTIQKFIEENQGTLYESRKDAVRCMYEAIFINFGKNVFRFGLRVGTFCFLFTFTATCLSQYRGKPRYMDYIVAGTVAGGSYKLKQGIRHCLTGTAVGTVLGCSCALYMSLMNLILGTTIDDVNAAIEARYRKEGIPPPNTPIRITFPGDEQQPTVNEQKEATNVEVQKETRKAEVQKKT